jgi:TetR/AcrR family transcriptional regulator, ethionamide resistance regulator
LTATRAAQWLIWLIERRLCQVVGSVDEHEVERQRDALTEIIWRVVYLSSQ